MSKRPLHELLLAHTTLVYPGHPENDALADLLLDLSEYDSYIVGLASSVAAGAVLQETIQPITTFRLRFHAINDNFSQDNQDDLKILQTTKEYIDSLENIVHSIIDAQSKSNKTTGR